MNEDTRTLLAEIGERQVSVAADLFEMLVVALDRRGAISKREVVEVLEEAIPHLEARGDRALSEAVFHRVIRSLGGNPGTPPPKRGSWLRGVINGGLED